jgi:hypothetical protein
MGLLVLRESAMRWEGLAERPRNSSLFSAPACRPRTLDRPLLAYELRT